MWHRVIVPLVSPTVLRRNSFKSQHLCIIDLKCRFHSFIHMDSVTLLRSTLVYLTLAFHHFTLALVYCSPRKVDESCYCIVDATTVCIVAGVLKDCIWVVSVHFWWKIWKKSSKTSWYGEYVSRKWHGYQFLFCRFSPFFVDISKANCPSVLQTPESFLDSKMFSVRATEVLVMSKWYFLRAFYW